MDPEIYLIELYSQCKFVVQASAAAASALDRFGQEPSDTFGARRRYQREVFRNLHSLVVHAGNISRLLWPRGEDDPSARRRADELRERLELPSGTEVLEELPVPPGPREFGRRLDRWLEARPADEVVLLDHIATSREARVDLQSDRRMRTFDPASGELVLWGDRIDVGRVTVAVERLCGRVEEVLDDPEAVRARHSPSEPEEE